MKSVCSFCCFLFCMNFLNAQVYEMLPPENIRTIEFRGACQEFGGTPIVQLGTSLVLRFDDLRANEANYYYKIEHYDFDWTPSDLSRNEFLDGFDNLRIMNSQNSFGTLQSYTHYE